MVFALSSFWWLVPVFDEGDEPVWHGEKSDGTWFLDYACIYIEELVCALRVHSWAEEYS